MFTKLRKRANVNLKVHLEYRFNFYIDTVTGPPKLTVKKFRSIMPGLKNLTVSLGIPMDSLEGFCDFTTIEGISGTINFTKFWNSCQKKL